MSIKNMFRLMAVFSFALSGYCFASQDMAGSMRPAVWRSSRTASPDGFVMVATGAVHFHGVVFGTAAPNSYVAIFNSTTSNNVLSNFSSTAAFVRTDIDRPPEYYDIILSSGLVYNKSGTADVNLLWDFYIPQVIGKLPPWAP